MFYWSKFISVLVLTFLFACQKITQNLEGSNYQQVININHSQNSAEVKLIFSHNINGETNPCGCRKFPLGGLPQIFGLIQDEKTSGPILLVDSGDTFFPSSQIPKTMEKSLSFIAQQIASAMSQMGYLLMVPGDQDFALGADFLSEIAAQNSFKFLMTNAASTTRIPHVKSFLVKSKDKNIYFLGVTAPSVMQPQHKIFFTDPMLALESELKNIQNQKSEQDLIILISHSGMELDQKYAQAFPAINWIIGAHTMNFNATPVTEGETKITQVLSRNHYLGKITILFGADQNLKYSLLESREETQELINPNPMKKWLEEHKQKLMQIQQEEQKLMITSSGEVQLIATAQSCLECHAKQTEFWQKTPHSIAYATLYNNNAHLNSQCIECHSVGFQKENGFQRPMDIAYYDNKPIDHSQYMQDLGKLFANIKSVREASPTQIKTINTQWMKLDKKHKVQHNFANVQCLNCHDQAAGHPFAVEEIKTENFQNKCIQCHTIDQSPDWYVKNSNSIDQNKFKQNLKKVACPKGKAKI
jgi:nitrate reductase cytochrome c-type subunit